jgi:hypothetical protein
MPKNKLRYWLFAILTALGVGSYQAAQMLGCESGAIDDARTVPVACPGDPPHEKRCEAPNPDLGACIDIITAPRNMP